MKTTLDLNDELLAGAKALAARRRTTLTRVVEEGLQLRLRGAEPSAKGADAWLAAAVQQLGEHLVTFDKGFRKLLRRGELTLPPAA
jgi:hypothetical protein